MKKHNVTNEVRSEYDIRKLHPNISFADITYAELGWFDYAAPIVPPVITPEEIQRNLVRDVQQHLDNKAKEYRYDDIKSAVGYVGDPDPVFNAEGTAFRNWRSAVWRYCYTVLDEVVAETRAVPTSMQLISELPVFTLA